MNVRALNLLRASLAASQSASRHHRTVGWWAAEDIAAHRSVIVTPALLEAALAARADELEARHLSYAADELRALERAA